MSRAQLARKTAFQIDPLLAASVQISDEPVLSRINGEIPADDFWKQRRRWDTKNQKWVWLPMALLILIAGLLITSIKDADAYSASCPTLQEGSTGQAVTELQYRLRSYGWVLAVDGQFGPRTEHVVVRFQQTSGLYADGVVGPQTQRALKCGQVAPATAYQHPNGDVERWHSTFLAVGWSDSNWRWMSCVIHRESKGQPGALANDSDDLSYGLTQLNTKDGLWSWFVKQGLTERSQLHDPSTNLRIALRMFNQMGKRPWRSASQSC